MGVRRVEFTSACTAWPTNKAWLGWCRRMGLDPDLVAVPGFIEADDDARTVTAECYVQAGPGRGNILRNKAGDAAARVITVLQLEAPALPMPAVYP